MVSTHTKMWHFKRSFVIFMKNPDFWAKSGPNPDHFAQKSPDPDQSPEIRTKVEALHSWQFVIIPSPASIFKLAKFKLEYWSGHFQDAVSTLSSTLPLLSTTMRTIGRWSLVDFLPDAGQGVGSYQAGGGDLHGSLWGREGVLIRLGMFGESSTLIFYWKNVLNGTLWKEKTFSCSMTRNIIPA